MKQFKKLLFDKKVFLFMLLISILCSVLIPLRHLNEQKDYVNNNIPVYMNGESVFREGVDNTVNYYETYAKHERESGSEGYFTELTEKYTHEELREYCEVEHWVGLLDSWGFNSAVGNYEGFAILFLFATVIIHLALNTVGNNGRDYYVGIPVSMRKQILFEMVTGVLSLTAPILIYPCIGVRHWGMFFRAFAISYFFDLYSIECIWFVIIYFVICYFFRMSKNITGALLGIIVILMSFAFLWEDSAYIIYFLSGENWFTQYMLFGALSIIVAIIVFSALIFSPQKENEKLRFFRNSFTSVIVLVGLGITVFSGVFGFLGLATGFRVAGIVMAIIATAVIVTGMVILEFKLTAKVPFLAKFAEE